MNDLQFQFFVIDNTPPHEAITIKVHIEPAVCKEFTDQQVRDAILSFISDEDLVAYEAVEVRQFPRALPKN